MRRRWTGMMAWVVMVALVAGCATGEEPGTGVETARPTATPGEAEMVVDCSWEARARAWIAGALGDMELLNLLRDR